MKDKLLCNISSGGSKDGGRLPSFSIPLMMKYAENIKSDFIRLSPRLANKFKNLNY